MNPYLRIRVLFATAAAVALVACGGGGSGNDGSTGGVSDDDGHSGTVTPTPSPPASSDPAEPTAATGLSDPTLELQDTLAEAVKLSSSARTAVSATPYGAAAIALAKSAPGGADDLSTPLDCDSGSVTASAATGGGYTYTYSSCKIGAYTFSGSALAKFVDGSTTAFTVDYNSDAGIQFLNAGSSDRIKGILHCTTTTSGAAAACTVEDKAVYDSDDYFKWGYDVALTGAGAQGTHQCGCEHTWNVTFTDMTSSSGDAYVKASNGRAFVKRTGDKDFKVTIVIDEPASRSSYEVELED